MAGIPKEHNELYFDNLCRTQKAETVLSLIQASYHAFKSNPENLREEIAKRLEYAYNLFRDNVKGHDSGSGTYSGSIKQFESQYTIGHELCIWKDSSLHLNDLAIEVAENKITIKDYFDIVFLNYFQPVNGKAIHPLYLILKSMINNHTNKISKSDLPNVLGVEASLESINALCNFLNGTNYLRYTNDKLLYVGKNSIKYLLDRCNKKYIGDKGLSKAREELYNDELYAKYIVSCRLENLENSDSCKSIFDYNSHRTFVGENLIVYGTPGCGKSFYVDHIKLGKNKITGEYEGDFNKENIIRTTFFQDYTNTDFVGQILPIVTHNKDTDKDDVTYKFNPGPFTIALNIAIQNPDKKVALVIEELNRGNAASIFGDIFQLLDRDCGVSVYNITNVNIQKYLEDNNSMYKFDNIRIPSNLFIYATMNTSDQNVFTLDTAFKRRWNFEKIKNTFQIDHPFKNYYIPTMDITWEDFCNAINKEIVNSDDFLNSEDKQLGVYFVDQKCLRKEKVDASDPDKRKEFAYKVFEYLWDDVAKYDHTMLFNPEFKTLDDLIDKYVSYSIEYNEQNGTEERMSPEKIFKSGIFTK